MDTSQPGEDRLDDLFADCPHPPIQLPLEYQLHKKSIAATSSYLAKGKYKMHTCCQNEVRGRGEGIVSGGEGKSELFGAN